MEVEGKLVESHHISWHIYHHDRYLVLMEIVENYYEYNSLAIVPKIELKETKRVLRDSDEGKVLERLKRFLEYTTEIYKQE